MQTIFVLKLLHSIAKLRIFGAQCLLKSHLGHFRERVNDGVCFKKWLTIGRSLANFQPSELQLSGGN